MSPVDVYLNAIVAMYDIANLYQWDAIWPRRTVTFSLLDHAVWVRVERDLRRMLTLHAAFALYYTVVTMVDRRDFYRYETDLYQANRLIGGLIIEPTPPETTLNTSIDAFHYISATDITTSDSTSQSPDLGRSIYVHGMNITYQYAADRINSQDLFTAVLSGLADAAKAGMDIVCTDFQAVSHSGNLLFWINGEHVSPHRLTYRGVTDILRGVTVDMTLQQRRFAEISFIARIAGHLVASGIIGKTTLQGNGNASVAAAR